MVCASRLRYTLTHMQKKNKKIPEPGILALWVSVYGNYDYVLRWNEELKTVMTKERRAINHIRSLPLFRAQNVLIRWTWHRRLSTNESVANNSMWHRWLSGTLDLFMCTFRSLIYTNLILSALWLIGGAFETSVHCRKIPRHVVCVIYVASLRMQMLLLCSCLISLRLLLHRIAQFLE